MCFQWAADKTTAEYNQPVGTHVSCVNYSNDCWLVGRPSLVLCLRVTMWAASIIKHVPLGSCLTLRISI